MLEVEKELEEEVKNVSKEDLLLIEISRLKQLLAHSRAEKAEVDIELSRVNYNSLISSISVKYNLKQGDSFKPDTGEILRQQKEQK